MACGAQPHGQSSLRPIGHETVLVAVLLANVCGEYSEKRLIGYGE